jgi:tight adherence protein C
MSAGDVVAIKAGAAVLALAPALAFASLLPVRLALPLAVALPAGGFFAPDRWLRRRARERTRSIEAELPDLLDLLRVALAAGLALERAFAQVARGDRGLLAGEWRRTAAELAFGVPREQALDALSARCPSDGIVALCAALVRSHRHGAPLGETLAALAHDVRAQRARRLAERAARAAPQIQLVVALALVPSVLLLVAAALLASLLG